MRNKMIIISFVLSYNSSCELLEPKELRDEIKEKVALMNNIYNGEKKTDGIKIRKKNSRSKVFALKHSIVYILLYIQ